MEQHVSEALFTAVRASRAIQSLMILIVLVEGSMARAHRREPRTANPYQPGELAAAAWFSGWDDAETKAIH
jgi:hypothetical protein